jgi:hypothetical protein
MWVLLIPVVALLLALLWGALRGSPRRTREAMLTIEGYRRMVAALERPGGERDAASPGRAGAIIPATRAGADDPGRDEPPARDPDPDDSASGERGAHPSDGPEVPAAVETPADG